MTREEYICEASKAYSEYEYDQTNYENVFINGAKWADETMIEKACKWLEQHQEDYNMYDAWRGDYVNFQSLIIDFRKAMEK